MIGAPILHGNVRSGSKAAVVVGAAHRPMSAVPRQQTFASECLYVR
jgi:hypothetical protein